MATAANRKMPGPLPEGPASNAASPNAVTDAVRVRGCRVHNLKNIDFEIPHNQLTVVTGVSGSGKSSLAFDTIYAEGQRRYVESMSAYARQFLERMEKPEADEIIGIAPSIAIRQKNTTRNPRSTVGTVTEIYDYLRLLYARVGQTFCWQCGGEVKKQTVDEVAAKLLARAAQSGGAGGLRAYLLFPMFRAALADGDSAPSTEASNEKQVLRRSTPQDDPTKTEAGAARRRQPAGAEGPAERLKARLFELRKLGFNRLYQHSAINAEPSRGTRDLRLPGKIVEFSAPESLLELDFTKPVFVLADRLVIAPESRQRLIDGLEICYREGGEVVVEFPGIAPAAPDAAAQDASAETSGASGLPQRITFNDRFECKRCRIAYEEPEPRLFSFNSPYGACPRCHGFGNTIDFDPDLVIPDPTRSLDDGAVDPWTKPRYRHFYHEFRKLARDKGVRLNVPYFKLTPEEKEVVWNGRIEGKRGRRAWVGINGLFAYLDRKKYKLHVRVFLSRYRGYALCPECKSGRLRKEAYWVRVGGKENGKDLREVCQMSIEQVRGFFDTVQLSAFHEVIAGKILQEVRQRLAYLENVGLEYLTLDRLTATLSGGEAQRIQLASSLGSQLVGALYVLDEPSIGLHSRDTGRLIRILEELRDQGNTILVVEHDPAMMETADRILDLGPGAGEHGGRVQFAGSFAELLTHNGSLTASYLRGDLRIHLPPERRKPTKKQLKITGAFAHNLKQTDVAIPLDMMVAITGVSGSGKSSLVYDVLYEALRDRNAEPAPSLDLKPAEGGPEDTPAGSKLHCRGIEGTQHVKKVVMVDQSPIGRTPRSNPVTYVKAFDPIRTLFSEQIEARRRGYSPGYFSFNIPGGRCETCQGSGVVTVEMQFLADVELVCEDCKGQRFKPGVLEITYKGRSIHEALQLTVKEALTFFSGINAVLNRLRILDEVGLGYLRLGQSATTLSGGEAQRIKLAAHLAAKESEGTLYLFDEPTTGLHFDDINKLLAAFRKLLDNGGSIVVIEHHMDVIKTADWVIDLGPEGGNKGGEVVAAGTPEKIARASKSYTGKYLRPVLERHRQWGEAVG